MSDDPRASGSASDDTGLTDDGDGPTDGADDTVTDGDALAAVSDVSRSYGGVTVLDGVSLSVSPGVTAVVGPNGSGKSTLLGILAGVIEPTTGEVRHGGADARKPVGYLPQRVPFRDGFTARETLAFYGRLVDADPDAALERVGLSDAADKRVESLSGGMRRLLGIAQALLGDPPVAVLDEPASGLDPTMRERAFRTAAERAPEGTAVVISSHNLELVEAHADHLVVVDRGRIAAAGPIDRLRADYDVESVDELYRAATGREGGIGTESAGSADEDGGVHVTGVSDR